ncbi:MAG: sigma factor-like helix-turn-helix DNA-binding protein [Polyangiales bacterium]
MRLRADLSRVPDHASLWPSEAPDDATDRRDARLREALDRALTPRQRDIVAWHFFEGISQGDIARRLGVTQQVVQKAIYGDTRRGRRVGGALQRLRAALGVRP